MTDIAIKVQDLGKKYLIQTKKDKYSTIRDSIVQQSKKIASSMNPFKDPIFASEKTEFWPIRNINFEIKAGEKIGVIGRNGAGKSTLLKLLSRITEPTEGKIGINGKVASLLEVGTGFHPELTGRENIFLNGSILGMSRTEIVKKMDEIVDFAEIEKFLDTPVKRYSSGMYMRLAFAIAAHLDPEILIVDEVLAVGDMDFQKKCMGKMEDAKNIGKTVLFVSHNMQAISSLCEKSIFLSNGKMSFFGSTNEAIQRYLNPSNSSLSQDQFSGPLKNQIIFSKISINNNNGSGIILSPNQDIEFCVSGHSKIHFTSFRMALSLYKDGIRIFTARDVEEGTSLARGNFTFFIKIPKYILRPGIYSVAIGGRQSMHSEWINGRNICDFIISEEWDCHNEQESEGLINIPYTSNRAQN